jgi:RluA family pseudouridine synthase
MTISKNALFKSSSARIVTPYPLTRTLSVKPKDAGIPWIEYMVQRFSFISRRDWLNRISRGLVWLDDGSRSPDTLLKPNQVIYHHNPAIKEPSVPDSVRVLEESDIWLLVYKPAPMPVHQGGRYFKNTLIYILKEMGYEQLRVVHRLDAVTSGLVLFAKNREAAELIQSSFSSGNVQRYYYALVNGVPGNNRFGVEAPVRRKKGFVFECAAHLRNAKPAKTEIELIQKGNNRSIVKCIPHTGRTHQIRLHLRYAGLPVIDDPIYGPAGDTSGKKLQGRAIKLQSSGLRLDDLTLDYALGLPEDWLEEIR